MDNFQSVCIWVANINNNIVLCAFCMDVRNGHHIPQMGQARCSRIGTRMEIGMRNFCGAYQDIRCWCNSVMQSRSSSSSRLQVVQYPQHDMACMKMNARNLATCSAEGFHLVGSLANVSCGCTGPKNKSPCGQLYRGQSKSSDKNSGRRVWHSRQNAEIHLSKYMARHLASLALAFELLGGLPPCQSFIHLPASSPPGISVQPRACVSGECSFLFNFSWSLKMHV